MTLFQIHLKCCLTVLWCMHIHLHSSSLCFVTHIDRCWKQLRFRNCV